jgi:PAS domain S-box-containing protein
MNSESSRKLDVPRFHKAFTLYLLAVFCILFLALLVVLGKHYRSNTQYENASLLSDFKEQVSHIENLLAMVTTRIEGMRIRAEWDLLMRRQQEALQAPPAFFSLTEENPAAAFNLDHVQPPLTTESVGNLTGVGQLRNRDPAFYRELYMALDLNPDFRATSEAIKDAAWVYYTSAADFLNIYPWVSSAKFKFSYEFYTHEFFQLGTPEKNPERKLFWTEVYVDEYGKGLMTTCAAPVYDQDRFLGTVAIDLTVDFLNSIVKKFRPQTGEMFLVNDRGQLLAHPSVISSADTHTKSLEAALPEPLRHSIRDIAKIEENRIVALDGYEVIHQGLAVAPWQAIYIKAIQPVPERFLAHLGIGVFLLITGLLLLVTSVLWVTHRKFVVPSGQLVDFMQRRSHGDASASFDAAPAFWKPWFQTIDSAFRENEELTARIRGQNEELERKVAERTAELSAANAALMVEVRDRTRAEDGLRDSEQRVRRKLDAILEPEGDLGSLELSDVIDVDAIQSLMDDFYRVTKIGVAIIDLSGKVLVGTGWQDICTQFHRVHPETLKNCLESDLQLSQDVPLGAFKLYHCKNNLWDMATPIVLGGKHFGNIFLGQFFFEEEPLDYELFRHQARRYGFDEEAYLAALDRLPRRSRETVTTVMNFYSKFASMVSSLYYANIKLARILAERDDLYQKLSESEKKYRAFFENAPLGIFRCTFEGDLLEVNPALARLLGYDSPEAAMSEVHSMTEQICIRPEKPRAIVAQQPRMPPTMKRENRFRRRNGTEFDANLYLNTIHDEEGKPLYLEGIVEDITQRKQSEEERRQLEERLQRAEKMEALGTLAGGVAHDLNNVLGIVVGYSELLLDSLDESGPGKAEALQVLKGGQRAAAIVQDLLTLARRGVSSRKVLNLNKVVKEFQQSPEFAQLLSLHPRVHIETDVEPDLLNVSGSSVHLVKSIYNLVSNAAEAMPNGGTITIKTRNHYLDRPVRGYDEVKGGDYVVLSVADTGEGIAAADLKRIFEPFYTKKVMGRSGTGLGLAVVWGTVKDHLGYIDVASEEGRGTIFTLYFPVTREETTAEQVSTPTSEYMGKGESILVVDDVPEQRELASMMLEKLNYRARSVSSGEQAVAYLNEHEVDLVVLDMIMDPGIDGLETYRRIVQIRPRQKAIIVSGFAETERVKEAQSLGAGSYVKKPYVLEKFGLAVKRELDRTA